MDTWPTKWMWREIHRGFLENVKEKIICKTHTWLVAYYNDLKQQSGMSWRELMYLSTEKAAAFGERGNEISDPKNAGNLQTD
jgi:hypothetical protein